MLARLRIAGMTRNRALPLILRPVAAYIRAINNPDAAAFIGLFADGFFRIASPAFS